MSALSKRVKVSFKLLASSLGNSSSVKTTSLSTSVIKIISKIYNHPITTEECLSYKGERIYRWIKGYWYIIKKCVKTFCLDVL